MSRDGAGLCPWGTGGTPASPAMNSNATNRASVQTCSKHSQSKNKSMSLRNCL